MRQTDVMLRIMDKDRTLRASLARTSVLAEEARMRQNAGPVAAAALGRTLTGAVMMGLDLKGDESLTLRINGGGPLGSIVAVAESDGTVRGYVGNPDIELPEKSIGKLDVGQAVGVNGYLEVVRDMRISQPFIGRVPLVSGEIAEDLASYFSRSEQIPSLVSLGVLIETNCTVASSGGLFVQAMPGSDPLILEQVENNVFKAGPISHLVQDKGLDSILDQIMAGIPYDIIEERKVSYSCRCSQEKVLSIISALEDEDIEIALEDQGCLEICCNFCGEVYRFSEKEVVLFRKTQFNK